MRPLLILDLDETLVWSTRAAPESGYDFRVMDYFVVRRPHLSRFLDRVFEWYDIAAWTSSGEHYAQAVCRELFGESRVLEFLWSAARCTPRFDHEAGRQVSIKDLRKVRRLGYPLERVLVIDDSPEKLVRSYGNHLRIAPFEGDPADRELLDLLPFLDWLRAQEDLRAIEKRTWKTRVLP